MRLVPTLASAVVLAGLALSATPMLAAVDATRALSVASQNVCMGCRVADRRLVGSAYQGVAAKYKNGASTQAKFIEEVRKGGMGSWGQVLMSANLRIADTDLKTVIDQMLVDTPAK